jgi:Zn-dependent protease with chaperone function
MDVSYFDGRSSRRRRARIEAERGLLHLFVGEGKKRIPLSDIRVSEPQGSAPRTLRFPDESYCEISQGPDILLLLKTIGHTESAAVRLQSRWRIAVFALVSVFLAFGAAYRWGLPWGAKIAAPLVPIALMDRISESFLNQFDATLFKPSTLSAERQRAIQRRFQKLAASDPKLAPDRHHLRLYFRNIPRFGPNAFTLPGGQIILLDKLVEMPASDDEILAVLAHEIGHFRERHSIRMLIQSSVVGFFVAVYFGDASFLAAGLSAAVLNSSYSREMEREADDYAIIALRRLGMSPEPLASALEKLEGSRLAKRGDVPEKKDNTRRSENWFSSHPSTEARIRRIRASED